MLELPNYGRASVRRVYGDWTNPQLKAWKDYLLKYSITPIQQFAYTTRKNATDGAMIIDAMDLLYTRRFNSFCLVSSDSDFTRLAARIREQDVTVYGIGKRHSTPAFVAACDKFVYFDALKEEPSQNTSFVPPRNVSYRPLQKFLHKPSENVSNTPLETVPEESSSSSQPPDIRAESSSPLPLDQAAIDGITAAIQNCAADDDNYVNLSRVGEYLSRYSPDLDYRNYHYTKLKHFVMASKIVEMKGVPDGNNRITKTVVALNEDVSASR